MSFLQTIVGLSLPPGAFLVTIDIECLYNSIPHKLGIEVVKSYLDQMGTDSLLFNTFYLELLLFILPHNAFLFNVVPLL